MRRAVSELKADGLSYAEIAKELDIAKSSVAYHVRNLGEEPDGRFSRRYDWGEIQASYDSGLSLRGCMKLYGFTSATWHKAKLRGDVVPRPRAMEIERLLGKGSTKPGRANLKRRLIDAGLKEDRCEQCGIDEWLGLPISIQLHHKNGDGGDNRLFNLEFLCPNCHSQTDTWGGRNKRRTPPDVTNGEPPT